MWLSLILKNWQLVVIGLLVTALAVSGAYIKLIKAQKENLVLEVQNTKAALEISQASVKSLQLAITEQNAAIDKLKKDSDERQKANAVALAKAKQDAANLKIKADDLMKIQRDTSVTACEAADNLFNSVIKK